jgi:hypothetical protein
VACRWQHVRMTTTAKRIANRCAAVVQAMILGPGGD